jgi:hypothetical protein
MTTLRYPPVYKVTIESKLGAVYEYPEAESVEGARTKAEERYPGQTILSIELSRAARVFPRAAR